MHDEGRHDRGEDQEEEDETVRVAGRKRMGDLHRELSALSGKRLREDGRRQSCDRVARGPRDDELRLRVQHQNRVDVPRVETRPGLFLGVVGRELERAGGFGVESAGDLGRRRGRPGHPDRDVMGSRVPDRRPDQP